MSSIRVPALMRMFDGGEETMSLKASFIRASCRCALQQNPSSFSKSLSMAAPHVHEHNNELIYVLQGPVAVLVEETWKTIETGGMVIIPAGTTHTFKNDSSKRVGILNIYLNGTYEAMMPQIMKMYADK